MPTLRETNRTKPLFNVDKEQWLEYNCKFCLNKRTCKLYDAIYKKRVEPENFTANTIECSWLRYR